MAAHQPVSDSDIPSNTDDESVVKIQSAPAFTAVTMHSKAYHDSPPVDREPYPKGQPLIWAGNSRPRETTAWNGFNFDWSNHHSDLEGDLDTDLNDLKQQRSEYQRLQLESEMKPAAKDTFNGDKKKPATARKQPDTKGGSSKQPPAADLPRPTTPSPNLAAEEAEHWLIQHHATPQFNGEVLVDGPIQIPAFVQQHVQNWADYYYAALSITATFEEPPPEATDAKLRAAVETWSKFHRTRESDGIIYILHPNRAVREAPQWIQDWMRTHPLSGTSATTTSTTQEAAEPRITATPGYLPPPVDQGLTPIVAADRWLVEHHATISPTGEVQVDGPITIPGWVQDQVRNRIDYARCVGPLRMSFEAPPPDATEEEIRQTVEGWLECNPARVIDGRLQSLYPDQAIPQYIQKWMDNTRVIAPDATAAHAELPPGVTETGNRDPSQTADAIPAKRKLPQADTEDPAE